MAQMGQSLDICFWYITIQKKGKNMLFDSHAHINNDTYTQAERDELIKEIESSDLSYVMDVGFDLPSSQQALKDARENIWCYAAVGVHPHDAETMTEEILSAIDELAWQDKVKAIGEIGLDFHYDNSPRDVQEYWFRRQIRLANQLAMPIIIHSREADQKTMDILKEEGAFSQERIAKFHKRQVISDDGTITEEKDARVLLHCFSGSSELGRQYIKLGASLSVAGPVTYKNNRKTVDVVREIPIGYLMVETDSPYLTPVPFRGKPNKPIYVEYTARKIAEIKGLSYEKVAEITMENAKRFFNIR